jgi:putative two-component system response regulator
MESDIIVKAMALHDVGKIGIPDSILLKSGPLEPDEIEIMKTHTVVGKNIVEEMMKAVMDKDSIYLKHCRDIAWCHHERFDGRGYPRGLVGFNIPLSARIASLSDVYDALVYPRVYKEALPYSEAISIISEGRGAQFEPVLTDAVLRIRDQFQKISQENQ